jgi:hypothetical protein
MHSLSDTNLFSETVKDGGIEGRAWASGGYGGSRTWALPAGGTLGFGLDGNYLREVLRGRTLGNVSGP